MSFVNEGRTFSAMFDSRPEADRAITALRDLGVNDVVMHGEGNAGYDETRRNPPEDRGFFEALADFFFPVEDRASYAEGLHRGGYLVTARNVPENLVGPARDVLDQHGSVDLDSRERAWRDEGWDAAHWHGEDTIEPAARPHGEQMDEEDVRLGRRDVDLGTVRVRSYVRGVPVAENVEMRRQTEGDRLADPDQPAIHKDGN